MGAGFAVRFATANALEAIRNLGVPCLLGGSLVVSEGHEKPPNEDEHATEPMPIELPQLREQPPLVRRGPGHQDQALVPKNNWRLWVSSSLG